MDNLLKDMGKRIFDRRKQLNMTQETLAELAHVTPQTISTAELGQKAMRPEIILKVCDALNISTEYLLRGIITETDSSLLMEKISTARLVEKPAAPMMLSTAQEVGDDPEMDDRMRSLIAGTLSAFRSRG